jgi:peptide/nickel transport system ATP-binding protein
MKSLLLEVRQLSMGFQDRNILRPVLKDISFSLSPGETLSIVGESGSGKSVSALSILKLIPSPPAIYTSGEILFHTDNTSVDLLKISNESLRSIRGKSISMIFQEPMSSLNPVFTCGDQVTEAIQLHQKVSKKEARELTLHWFKEVQLPRAEKLLDAYPHEISGGQKQRVMIAMAMCNHPKILIADEPTTALDVTVQKTILDLMSGLKEKYGTSMIFISHDLGLVKEISDRILVMYQGEIIEQGTAHNIFESPQQPYTQGLIACRPDPSKYLQRIPTVADFMQGTYTEGTGKFIQENAEIRINRAKDKLKKTPVLEVKNVSVQYSENSIWKPKQIFKAVDSVSFNLYPGEILGLVGESGCGKTTLSRALLQLNTSCTGEIKFNGLNLAELKESEIRKLRPKMQLIFQDPYSALNPRMSAGQAIREVIQVHFSNLSKNEIEERVDELFIQTGLDPLMHKKRYPHEFSGGQRQRICIARALATQPELLICDESVSALDVSIQAQILNLLNDLKEVRGFACLFISHDLQVVRYMSDRIMVMKDGKIVEEGITEEVCQQPSEAYTQSLLSSIPAL